jgi:hypothetical protein
MKKWACIALGTSLLVACSDDAVTDGPSDGGGGSTATTNPCCGEGGAGAGNGEGGSGAGVSGGNGEGGAAPLPCGAPATIENGVTPSAELHVATNGSDDNDGSAGSPFATIAHAASQATAGTAVVVHAGNYAADTYLSDFGGSEGAPIWIGGAEGEARPTITGGANGFHLSRVRHLIIHDLDISGGEANGVNCDDGGDYANDQATHHVVFRGVYIHDIGNGGNNDCLKLSGVNHFWVINSEIARCGGGMAGSGIDMVGCHDGVIAHSSFSEMSGNGVQTKGGSTDVTISANLFRDAGERAVNIGGSTGFEFFRPPLSMSSPNAEAQRIRVIANVIEGGTAGLGFVGCVDCLAANNTIIDPERWPFRILQETSSEGAYEFLPASNGRVINNVIYFDSGAVNGAHVNVGGDTAPETFTFTTNLWFAHDDPGASAPNLPVTEQGGIIGSDPLFVTPGDYHLAAGSPALGAGTSIPELSGDNDGACFASPPNIGAFASD